MGWPQRSSDRRRRRVGGFSYPITIDFDGDEVTYFDGGWAEGSGNVTNDQLALGAEEVSNGGFDTDTAGWTPADATLASIVGGQAGNALELTRTGAGSQSADNSVSGLNVGDWVDFSGYTKSGTSGNQSNIMQLGTGAAQGQMGTTGIGATSASWVQRGFTARLLAATAHFSFVKFSSTAGTMLFDTASLKVFVFTSLLNTLKSQFGLADGFFIDVYINAVTAMTQVGVIWNYDGSNNYGQVYLDGTDLVVNKSVGGTLTELASVTQAVTQDQILRIENPTGSNVLDILYNGVSKATPTIADAGIISNTGIALFSTEAANAISKVVIGLL